jgi:tetratricopeptide (TPR) repeat protein
MSGSSWDRVKKIILEALERPAAERVAHIDDACGADAQLRAEIRSLLDAHEATGSSLGTPTDEGETRKAVRLAPSAPLSEGPGTVIGRDKLLQVIGEGGFGLVYMAEQQEPVRRKVALKIIKLGRELADRGLHAQADKPFRHATESGRSLSDKLPLLESLIAWGSSRALAGETEEARALLDEAGALYHDLFVEEPIDWQPGIGFADTGERSWDAVTAKRDLVMALIDMGRLEEADELIRQVAAVSRAQARYATGRLLLARNDPAGAEPALRRAMFWGRRRDMDVEQPYRFARLECDYGRCLIDLHRHDEAEDLLVRAHARACEWAGPNSTVAEQTAAQLERLRHER